MNICLKSDAVLLGAIGDPISDNNPNIKIRPEQGLLTLRKEMKLYCNIRPIINYTKTFYNYHLNPEILKTVNFVIYRDLIGGIYFGKKGYYNNKAYDCCEYSSFEIESIGHIAFKASLKRKKELTLVDKANVLETSRLWRNKIKKIYNFYQPVKLQYIFVDNAAMQIIINPNDLDVILTENMFGDILSDEASTIVGSIGLIPSASIGKNNALFEPIHGSYHKASGKNLANPFASVLSVAMMLNYFCLNTEAMLLEKTVYMAIKYRKCTEDICSSNQLGTEEVGDLLVKKLLNQ
jgi:3-isopropylmalate dehydrogenase